MFCTRSTVLNSSGVEPGVGIERVGWVGRVGWFGVNVKV